MTGSRIAQRNLETTSPVTQVTAEDVVTQGVTKIEDLVNQLPQAFAAQNATVSNAATGTATADPAVSPSGTWRNGEAAGIRDTLERDIRQDEQD